MTMELNDKIKKYIFNNSNKIKINSKDIKKDDIFLALNGKKYHGNKFLVDAFNYFTFFHNKCYFF